MSVDTRRVMFTLPASLLEQVDQTVAELETSRSSFIREALERLIEERRRQKLRELLKEGYLYYAERDRRICEEFAYADYEAVTRYAPYDEGEND